LTVRRGRSGESYPGIRKPEIQLEGALVIADVDGPFGNPSADSLRTSVTESTRDFWFVLFVPVDVNIQAIDGWVAWLRERAEAYLAARAVSAVLP
jgi:DNA/RNA-binding domain of Phe-tRNA-synthetase-like protein